MIKLLVKSRYYKQKHKLFNIIKSDSRILVSTSESHFLNNNQKRGWFWIYIYFQSSWGFGLLTIQKVIIFYKAYRIYNINFSIRVKKCRSWNRRLKVERLKAKKDKVWNINQKIQVNDIKIWVKRYINKKV